MSSSVSLGVPSDQPQVLYKLLPFPACKYTCYSVALIPNLCFVLSQSLSSAVVVTIDAMPSHWLSVGSTVL